jgi:dihydroorotase
MPFEFGLIWCLVVSGKNCLRSLMIVPCLVDCHVHFREPGLTHKGDLLTESQAAHAGGVAVVCEMPNTIPPTQTIEALRDKVDRSKRCEGFCDVRFFFGATDDSHLSQLRELWQNPDLATLKTRCSGLKLYLTTLLAISKLRSL